MTKEDVIVPAPEKMDVWVVNNKRGNPIYCLSEDAYRRNVATQLKCSTCGTNYESNSFCRVCSDKKQEESYNKKPFKVWDGNEPLVIYQDDTYFFDEDQLKDYIYENDLDDEDVKNLRLMICEPNNCREIEEDYFGDEMPENMDSLEEFDKGLVEKLKEINTYIKTLPPISWSQGMYRTTYTIEKEDE